MNAQYGPLEYKKNKKLQISQAYPKHSKVEFQIQNQIKNFTMKF